jgi:integrase
MDHREVIQIVSNWFKRKKEVDLVTRLVRWPFPSPDIFIITKNNESISVECKPSGQSGREYITGLGQAISYFTIADFSYLSLPAKELQNYKKFFIIPEVGLLSVFSNFVKEERKPKKIKIKKIEVEYPKRGYAYYRDLNPEEIYKILSCIKSNSGKEPIIIKQKIWETIKRIRKGLKSQKQKMGWLINIQLFLRDLNLINIEDYTLKNNAEVLLEFDISKEEQRKLYLSELCKYLLLEGNYIDIVGLIQELNDTYDSFSNVNEFYEKLTKRIYEEKLATSRTDVKRDVKDIISILKKLGVLSELDKKTKKYFVRWNKVLPFVKMR